MIEEALKRYYQYRENKQKDCHMDGFKEILHNLLPTKFELEKDKVIQETPYRKKRWDYSVYEGKELVGVIEIKSLHKSANKNINNRQEESTQVLFLMGHRPNIKRSYLLIGDGLSEKTKSRWEPYFQDAVAREWYHSMGSVMLDDDKNYMSFDGFSIEDMMAIYK